MTREEKCKLAIERGYTYDPETGLIYNRYGKISNTHDKYGYIIITLPFNQKLKAHHFSWYLFYKECVKQLDHINGVRDDNRISNLRAVTNNENQWNRLTAKGYGAAKPVTSNTTEDGRQQNRRTEFEIKGN